VYNGRCNYRDKLSFIIVLSQRNYRGLLVPLDEGALIP
jgi:hypothetical protein